MTTTFGKFLRGLRQAHGELLKDMANKLGVSPAFLSSVETGKKSIPPVWEGAIAQLYSLPASNQRELKLAIDQSQKNATIDLADQSSERRGVAVALARQFNDLTDAQIEIIKKTMFATKNRSKDE